MFITRYLWSKLSISSGFQSFSTFVLLAAAVWLAHPAMASADKAAREIEIVALGDSLTAGYGLSPRDGFVPQLQAALRQRGHHVRVLNAGVSGDTSSGGRARLEWSVPPSADAVIVELGANDALRGVNPSITRENLTAIITTLQGRQLPILLAGMYAPPNLGAAYGDQFNSIYPELADAYDTLYYPFFLDGVAAQKHLNLADRIHPNRAGIEIIVSKILPTVEKLILQVK